MRDHLENWRFRKTNKDYKCTVENGQENCSKKGQLRTIKNFVSIENEHG